VEGSLAQRMMPEASDIVDGYNFGEVWARADLSPKERMVCVLTALMARGHWKQLDDTLGTRWTWGSTRERFAKCLLKPDGIHLWVQRSEPLAYQKYLLADLASDINSGHNVRSTVFIEVSAEYRADGPEELRPVGCFSLPGLPARRS